MDKAEYQSRLEELNSLVKKEDYEGALAVVEAVDWRRVKSLRTLGMVADVYEANKRYPEAKKILLMAYDRSSIGKGILYRLVEVSVKMKDFDEAIDFYNEFEAVARHDNSRYLLKYKILRGQKAPLEEQISLLEEYKEREFTERWAYELANLYSKAGETQKCIDACDELILWFSEGKYVTKAMDLKMKYEPLSPSQQIKYEHRFDYKKNEEPSEDPEALKVRLAGESGAGEMAATKEPAETPEVKPVNGGVMSQYVAGEEEKEAGSPYEAYEKTQQAEADAEQVQEYEALQQTEEPIEEIPDVLIWQILQTDLHIIFVLQAVFQDIKLQHADVPWKYDRSSRRACKEHPRCLLLPRKETGRDGSRGRDKRRAGTVRSKRSGAGAA